jgi:hypothetical protein
MVWNFKSVVSTPPNNYGWLALYYEMHLPILSLWISFTIVYICNVVLLLSYFAFFLLWFKSIVQEVWKVTMLKFQCGLSVVIFIIINKRWIYCQTEKKEFHFIRHCPFTSMVMVRYRKIWDPGILDPQEHIWKTLKWGKFGLIFWINYNRCTLISLISFHLPPHLYLSKMTIMALNVKFSEAYLRNIQDRDF